jgi:hypothetical protein
VQREKKKQRSKHRKKTDRGKLSHKKKKMERLKGVQRERQNKIK